ncbi:hypothetical protein I317_00946 [Kwoniella heveanensis CBS 569]|nr:hypothetical protein I317_00946 [Kwoniella heveanensis CBS 569]
MPPHTISPTPSSQGLGISFSTLSPLPVDPAPPRFTGMIPQASSSSPNRLAPAAQQGQTQSSPTRGLMQGKGQPLFQPTFSLRPTHTRTNSNKGFSSFSAMASGAGQARPMGPRSVGAQSPRIGGPSARSESEHTDTHNDNDEEKEESVQEIEEDTPRQRLKPLPTSPSRSASIASHFTVSSKHSERVKTSEMIRKYSRSGDTFGTRSDQYQPLSGEDEHPMQREPSSTNVEASPVGPLPHPRRPSTRMTNASASGSSLHHASPSKLSSHSRQTTTTDDSCTTFNARRFPCPPEHPPRSATAYSDPINGEPYYQPQQHDDRSYYAARLISRSLSQPQHLFAVPEFEFDHSGQSRQTPKPDRPASAKRTSDISSGIHSKNAVLLSAENGGMMLAFSPTGDGTFRAGEMICGSGTALIPSPASPPIAQMQSANDEQEDLKARPWSDSTMSEHMRKATLLGHRARSLSDGAQLLARQGTLLHPASSKQRASAELGVLLGGPKSRRLSQNKILPPPPTEADDTRSDWEKKNQVRLEASKKGKARVELDVVLERECVVEGGEVRGRMEVRITGGKRGEGLRVGGGKVRVVGFEELSTSSRHIFYHQPHPLPVFDPSIQHNLSSSLFASGPDSDGYRLAAEGTHSIPFRMRLPLGGGAKGTYTPVNGKGPCVKYVVVGSVKIHIPSTGKRSIAHFYRSIVVLPYLNPSLVLAPSQEPVEGYVERGLGWSLTGEKGRVELRVSLGRRFWVSGQRLWCEVGIRNDSNRKIKTLNLALLQTVQVFTPQPLLDTSDLPTRLIKKRRSLNCTGVSAVPGTPDLDACQTTTQRRRISEEVIEADFSGHGAGRVTGKGWWTGVDTGESGHWEMSLQIPPGMLSIRRTRLIEVQYMLRVTVNNSIYVDVPVQLINFLSIDPPPMPRDGSVLVPQISQAHTLPVGSSQPLQVAIKGNGVYQQARPGAPRSNSDFSLDSAVGPARASSTTLHIDALLQAGRARAEAEAMAHLPPPAHSTRPRPLSLGSSYSVSRPDPTAVVRIKSNPALRPKGARTMSAKTEAQSVFSGEDVDEEEEDEETEDKAILAARRAQGRQRSLAAIHQAIDKEKRELLDLDEEDQDAMLSPTAETPPEGAFRPCHTPSEEMYAMAGDTPSQNSERAAVRTPLPVGSPVQQMRGLRITNSDDSVAHGTEESDEHDSPNLQEAQEDPTTVVDQHENEDGRDIEDDEVEAHTQMDVGNETVLADMIPEEREELQELMSQQGHESGAHEYDYGEDVEDDYAIEVEHEADPQADGDHDYREQSEGVTTPPSRTMASSTSFGRLPFLATPYESDRDRHIAQTRSMYGSFAASAVSGMSEQESEVGQVYEAVKRNVSVKIPSRLLPLPNAEPEGVDEKSAQQAQDIGSVGMPRTASISHSLLAGARRASQTVQTRRDSSSSTRSGADLIVTSPNRRGSTLSINTGVASGMRRDSSVNQSSPLRKDSSTSPMPVAKVIQKKNSFSYATPGSPLKVKAALSTSPTSYEQQQRQPAPRRHLSPGLSPKSLAPAGMEMTRQLSASSQLRHEIVPSDFSLDSNNGVDHSASPDPSDDDHVPGLAPSVASDSASSEGHALESPNPITMPHITTSPPPKRSLPLAPHSAFQPFPVPEVKGMMDARWTPGAENHFARTHVHYAHTAGYMPQDLTLSPTSDSPGAVLNHLPEMAPMSMSASLVAAISHQRETSLPIPVEDVSLHPSPASSPSSCHSILPSVRTKIAQLESRDEALRKFSVSGSVPSSVVPSRQVSINPTQVLSVAIAPTASGSFNGMGGSSGLVGGPGSPNAKRRSYTAALAPRPTRTASADSYVGSSVSSGYRYDKYIQPPAGQHGNPLGHTTYLARKNFAPQATPQPRDRHTSLQDWLDNHGHGHSQQRQDAYVPGFQQQHARNQRPTSNYYATDSIKSRASHNGSAGALSPRSMAAPRLDPFGLGFGKGSVMGHVSEGDELRSAATQESGMERNASIRSTSTSATDIERAFMSRYGSDSNSGTASGGEDVRGMAEEEEEKTLKPKPSGFWEGGDGVGFRGGLGKREERVSVSEGETSESEGLL